MDASTPSQASPGKGRAESTVAGTERYKRFPPRWGGLYLPVSSRDLALNGLSMYPACRPVARAAVRGARAWIHLLGPKRLPGRTVSWVPPSAWSALEEAWSREVGAFDGIAVYQRVQSSRPGIAALLARAGEPIAFVKCRPADERLARERDALAAVARHGPESFVAPRPIGFGTVDGWTWCAQSPVIPGPNRPPRSVDLDRVVGEIQSALSSLEPSRPVPDHWRPMHGDFTPWNLRAVDGLERPTLVDWEDAGWGPPGADRILYCAVERALGGDAPDPPAGMQEAIEFWREDIGSWGRTGRDERLAQDVLAALREWDAADRRAS